MNKVNTIGTYIKYPFPKHRELLGNLASLDPKYPIQVLVEVDITEARAKFRDYKEKTGQAPSFTAWMIKCIAEAVSEHKQIQAYRKGRDLIVFTDVDVGIAMERQDQPKTGELVLGGIIRKADRKTVKQITEEIRIAQTEPRTVGPIVGKHEEARFAGFMQSLPGALRRLAVWWYRRDPFLRKRTHGTVGMTSVGNILGSIEGMSAFPLTSGPFPCYFGIGSISKKPGIVDRKTIEVRDILPMCVMFDHDVVDGADVARFLGWLGELLKGAYGLTDSEQ